MPRRKPMNVVASPQPELACTFCRKSRSKTGPLVAGPGVTICRECVSTCARLLTGKATAAFAGWDALTEDELLDALPATALAVESSDRDLRDHVARLRSRGVSWERIAGALGVSRQAAWERFSNES
jgi:hypothetical protein